MSKFGQIGELFVIQNFHANFDSFFFFATVLIKYFVHLVRKYTYIEIFVTYTIATSNGMASTLTER